MGALLSIFWGLLLFSFLVYIHEGGHYLAARLFGVRVLEFFIGFPSKLQLSWRSKKRGTKFGITPLLFGGYARIAGMDIGQQSPHLSTVLALVNARGVVSAPEIAYILKIPLMEAYSALTTLAQWGSLEEVDSNQTQVQQEKTDSNWVSRLSQEDREELSFLQDSGVSVVFRTPARDHQGKTIYDRPNFGYEGAITAGSPFVSELDAQSFLQREEGRTYNGLNPLKRIIVLLGGIFVNLLFALLIFVAIFMVEGVTEPQTTIQTVADGSIAQSVGIKPGDKVVSLGGHQISDWESLVVAIDQAQNAGKVDLLVKRDGHDLTLPVSLGEGDKLGVTPVLSHKDLSLGESLSLACEYTVLTGKSVLNLLNPAHIKETLDNSSSVVGVAVLAKDAASSGFLPFVTLMAAISLSLGMINLLPIPPLDGGKVVIEIIQGILGRPISEKVYMGVSVVGIALFILLFVYLTGQDIVRLISGA